MTFKNLIFWQAGKMKTPPSARLKGFSRGLRPRPQGFAASGLECSYPQKNGLQQQEEIQEKLKANITCFRGGRISRERGSDFT